MHDIGLVDLVVETELLDDGLDTATAVGGVVDRVVRGVAEEGGMLSEDLPKDRVEGAHMDLPSYRADVAGDTRLHLTGGLVGEGQRHKTCGVIARV